MRTELFYRQAQHEGQRKRLTNLKRVLPGIERRMAAIVRVPLQARTVEQRREYERLKQQRLRLLNPERNREAVRRYLANNPAAAAARRRYNQAYYRTHRDEILKTKREYVARNRPEYNAHARAYQREHGGYEPQLRYREKNRPLLAARARAKRRRQSMK